MWNEQHFKLKLVIFKIFVGQRKGRRSGRWAETMTRHLTCRLGHRWRHLSAGILPRCYRTWGWTPAAVQRRKNRPHDVSFRLKPKYNEFFVENKIGRFVFNSFKVGPLTCSRWQRLHLSTFVPLAAGAVCVKFLGKIRSLIHFNLIASSTTFTAGDSRFTAVLMAAPFAGSALCVWW